MPHELLVCRVVPSCLTLHSSRLLASTAFTHTTTASVLPQTSGNLSAAFDPWNSVWGDYGGDYPGKNFEGACLFDNYTGGWNTENIWFSGSDPSEG